MNITLKQLRVFVSVARSENVSRAGDELSLTQSAVSMALKELERQLGITLFDRVGKRILLNQQGHWLLPKAQHILNQVQTITREMGHAGRQMLSVGASTTIADCLFPRLVTHLYEQHPELELHLETGNSSTILGKLLGRKIELGLVEGICQHPQVTASPWWTDHLVIVANPDHPLAEKNKAKPLPVKSLLNSTWVMREAGSGTRAIFEHAFRPYLPGFTILAELQHVPTIKALVANSNSLACLSEIALSKEIASGELVVLNICSIQLERQFYILQHKQAFQSDIHTSLIQWIKQRSAMRTGMQLLGNV